MTEAWVSKWRVQKKKSIMRLPPDTSSLRLHLQQTNYLAYIQKQFMLKTHPSPLGQGLHVVNELCMPEKSSAPALPFSISVPVNIQSDEESANELTNANYSSESESEYEYWIQVCISYVSACALTNAVMYVITKVVLDASCKLLRELKPCHAIAKIACKHIDNIIYWNSLLNTKSLICPNTSLTKVKLTLSYYLCQKKAVHVNKFCS